MWLVRSKLVHPHVASPSFLQQNTHVLSGHTATEIKTTFSSQGQTCNCFSKQSMNRSDPFNFCTVQFRKEIACTPWCRLKHRCGADELASTWVGKVTRLIGSGPWATSLWAYSRLITEKSTPACLYQCFGMKEGTLHYSSLVYVQSHGKSHYKVIYLWKENIQV